MTVPSFSSATGGEIGREIGGVGASTGTGFGAGICAGVMACAEAGARAGAGAAADAATGAGLGVGDVVLRTLPRVGLFCSRTNDCFLANELAVGASSRDSVRWRDWSETTLETFCLLTSGEDTPTLLVAETLRDDGPLTLVVAETLRGEGPLVVAETLRGEGPSLLLAAETLRGERASPLVVAETLRPNGPTPLKTAETLRDKGPTTPAATETLRAAPCGCEPEGTVGTRGAKLGLAAGARDGFTTLEAGGFGVGVTGPAAAAMDLGLRFMIRPTNERAEAMIPGLALDIISCVNGY